MPIQLPALEYGFDALEPHISSTTLKTHHGKHHKTYVEKANQLLAGTPLAGATLEDIVRQAAQRKASDEKMAKLYNNAGQAWNHAFYWRSLRPQGGPQPQGALADAIRSAFGGQDKLEEQLKTAGTEHFGSGWAWLVQDGQTLRVVSTSNADSPLTTSQRAAADDRRVGARLLPRLPGEAPRPSGRGDRQPAELGLRGTELLAPISRTSQQLVARGDTMHSDFGPGRTFPDFVLPDGTNTDHQLSALQGGDPMLVVLIRSLLCPERPRAARVAGARARAARQRLLQAGGDHHRRVACRGGRGDRRAERAAARPGAAGARHARHRGAHRRRRRTAADPAHLPAGAAA